MGTTTGQVSLVSSLIGKHLLVDRGHRSRPPPAGLGWMFRSSELGARRASPASAPEACEQLAWPQAGEPAHVADQVGLVEVARRQRQARPATRPSLTQA